MEQALERDAVLIIDDEAVNRELLRAQLEAAGVRTLEASGGLEGIAIIERLGTELGAVLLDLHMPRVDGFEVLRRARAANLPGHLPIIVVTAASDRDSRRRAAAVGADEFLTKPADQIELVAKVRNAIRWRRLFRRMISVQGVLDGLAIAIESRDHYTEDHTLRVSMYSLCLAEALDLSLDTRLQVLEGGLVHDVGKIAVPDAILLKEGKLTPEEYEMMKRHVLVGAQICEAMGVDAITVQLVRHHHERFDGNGYPDGLAGERIPLAGRIAAVADAFDAMTSNRPYRSALSWEAATNELKGGRGSQWDPAIVDAFLEVVATNDHVMGAAREGGSRLHHLLRLRRAHLLTRLEVPSE